MPVHLDRIRDATTRLSVSLTQSYSTLRHFELAEEQKKATEEVQHRFEVGAAVLLVPTLIAGIYGANTLLPGGGHWSGFIAMVTLMVLGSGAAYFALEKDAPDGQTRPSPVDPLRMYRAAKS